MRTFFLYWWRVCVRAFGDTWALFPFAERSGRHFVNLAIFVIATAILYFIAGASEVIAELNMAMALGLAFAVVFVSLFTMNFVVAPSRIDRDIRSESSNKDRIIEKLKEEKIPKLSVGEPNIAHMYDNALISSYLTVKNISLRTIRNIQVRINSISDRNNKTVFTSPSPLRLLRQRYEGSVTNPSYDDQFDLHAGLSEQIAIVEWNNQKPDNFRLCLALDSAKSLHIPMDLSIADHPYTFEVGIYSEAEAEPIKLSYIVCAEKTDDGMRATFKQIGEADGER